VSEAAVDLLQLDWLLVDNLRLQVFLLILLVALGVRPLAILLEDLLTHFVQLGANALDLTSL